MKPIFLAIKKKNNDFCDIFSWLDIRLTKALRNPRGTNRYLETGIGVCQTPLRMPFVDSERLRMPQRHRWARANEHFAASKHRGGGDTEQKKSENIPRISRGRPGRQPVRLESCGPDRADGV